MSIICNNLSASNVNSDVNDAKSNMTKLSNMLSVLMEAYPALQSNQPVPNQLKGLWGGDGSLQVNEDGSLNLDSVSHSSVNYSLLKDDNGNQIWKLSNNSLSGTVKLSSSGAVSDFNIYVKPSNGSQFGKSNNIVGLPPSQPRNLVASAGNGLVDLSWSAPSNSGTSSVSSYKVYINDSLLTNVSGLSHRVSGLSNGTSYLFSVSAVNSYGESPLSSSSSAIPNAPQPPPAPSVFIKYLENGNKRAMLDISGGIPGAAINVYINDIKMPDPYNLWVVDNNGNFVGWADNKNNVITKIGVSISVNGMESPITYSSMTPKYGYL